MSETASTEDYLPWAHDDNPDYIVLDFTHPPAIQPSMSNLNRGASAKHLFPSGVRFSVSWDGGVQLTDSLCNSYGFYVVSERLRERLAQLELPFEFFDVQIQNHKERLEKARYYVVNLLYVLDCVDRTQSEFTLWAGTTDRAMRIRRLVLNERKIPDGTPIFRLSIKPEVYMVRRDLAYEIREVLGYDGMFFPQLEHFGLWIR